MTTSPPLSQEQFQERVLLKLDYLAEEMKELKEKMEELSHQHNGHSNRLTVLETRVKDFQLFLSWIAGILAAAISAILAALGISYLGK